MANCNTDKDHPKQERFDNPAWPFKSTAKPVGAVPMPGTVDAQPSETLGSMEHAGEKSKEKK